MKRAALAVTLLLASFARTASASGPIGVGTPVEAAPPPSVGLEPGNRRAFWSNAPVGVFASSIVDAGYIYLRPQFAVGWGRPHWHFVQLETNATISAGTVGKFVGGRFSLAHLDFRSGMRFQMPFARSLYEREESYDRFSLESRKGPSSRYFAWDTDVMLSGALGPGAIFGLFTGHYVMGIDEGYDLYEEQLRVMMRAPWLFRGRVGYSLLIGEKGSIRVGPVAELIYNPARNSRVVRGGIVATVVLTHHVEILATFVPTLASTDSIGLAGGDFGQLGLRYRWASPHGYHSLPAAQQPQP